MMFKYVRIYILSHKFFDILREKIWVLGCFKKKQIGDIGKAPLARNQTAGSARIGSAGRLLGAQQRRD